MKKPDVSIGLPPSTFNFNLSRVRTASGGLAGRASLGELLDHLAIERGDVVGFPTGNEPVVDDHLLIDPVGAGVISSPLTMVRDFPLAGD